MTPVASPQLRDSRNNARQVEGVRWHALPDACTTRRRSVVVAAAETRDALGALNTCCGSKLRCAWCWRALRRRQTALPHPAAPPPRTSTPQPSITKCLPRQEVLPTHTSGHGNAVAPQAWPTRQGLGC
ncbi:hypothetical protein E2C01_026807 [Portunus trituberculatus]|uniref:Uncharacterized protein n=1 Tax=Portunus trituberculatus TaxID=210409 RepID=A0A5B7EJN2_PORTR|nr:hypothetical protein [Portunus trituberculatus]